MSERENLIFASLLHDIGKLAQRGEEVLKDGYRKGGRLEQDYCPFNKKRNYYTHHHLLYSAQFIKEIFKINVDQIENLILAHHKPEFFLGNKKLSYIIQLADWLSSGERKKEIEEEKEIQKEPLISIFSQIEIGKAKTNGEKYCKPVKIEKSFENFMPVERKEDAITDKINFKKLWSEFKEEAKKISFSSNNFRKLFNQFLFLLEKYTLFVPSAVYKAKSEISLFHHLKSTTAIATCLYDLNLNENEITEITEKFKEEKFDDRKPFILLSGDISGIQDFIYSITSEHALKGLRGRSFYLQLLAEAIAYRILDEFNLTLCNLLYIGGGGFLILLPNKSDTKKRIEDLTKEIDRKIFDAHKGKLGIVISILEISSSDFKIGNFGKVLEEIGKRNSIEKRKKFKYILDEEFFKPYPEKIEKELKGCEICGDEIEQGNKCQLCESFEGLALDIKSAEFMGVSRVNYEKRGKINSWDELIKNIGYEFKFGKNKPNSEIVFLLNETDFLNFGCDGFKFEAIYSPEGTLEDIAEKAEGVKRWGSLRMDVDNLGKIFRDGFKREDKKEQKTIDETTISRFSMLSYMLSMFFSSGIREIVENKYKDCCCIVYSGGDDLFIIGPWSKLPELAKEIYDNFRRYTAYHPKITLSGGIYIAPTSKFPVYVSAKEAGKAEDKAKKGDKNKIYFLDTEINWGEEFEKINEAKEKLYNLLKRENGKSKVSRSLLNILYAGYNEEKLIKKKEIPYPRIWRIFYGMKRFMERHKGYEKELEEIRKKFIIDYKLQPKLNVAVRWAELLTRKEEVKNE